MVVTARCGCSGGTCSCLVQAGANITVVGNGSVGLPYIISAASTGLSVSDSSTFHFSLIGSNLTGSVKLDGTAGNLISVAAGGLRVDCAAIAACGSATHLMVTDSSSIDFTLTGDGSVGTPYNVTGAVIVGPGLSTSGGGIIPNVGGSSFSGTWPCPDTDGAPVYVAGSGALIVDPPQMTQTAGTDVTGGTSPGATVVPAGDTAIDTATISITNPSTCRTAVVLLTYTVNVTYTLTAGNGIVVTVGGIDFLVDEVAALKTNVTSPITYTTQATLAAGATASFPQIISCRQAGTAGATYSATAWRVNFLLMTN